MESVRIWQVVCLAVCFICLTLAFENNKIRQDLVDREVMYEEFLNREVKGKKLIDYISPGTVGMFREGKKKVVCGISG